MTAVARNTTVLNKGEEALVSSLAKTANTEKAEKSTHYKTISATTEVKVGKGNPIHFRTIPSSKVPNSPTSKTIRCSTLAIPPSQHYQVHSPPPRGTVTLGDFPS